MRLEEQQPPSTQVWPWLVRVINGGLGMDNFSGKMTEGTTPFTVPGRYVGGWCLRQSAAGMVFFVGAPEGLSVQSEPTDLYVWVMVF